jgi:hypothetical protein
VGVRAVGVCPGVNGALEKCDRVGCDRVGCVRVGCVRVGCVRVGCVRVGKPLGACTAALGERISLISHLVEYPKFAPY